MQYSASAADALLSGKESTKKGNTFSHTCTDSLTPHPKKVPVKLSINPEGSDPNRNKLKHKVSLHNCAEGLSLSVTNPDGMISLVGTEINWLSLVWRDPNLAPV